MHDAASVLTLVQKTDGHAALCLIYHQQTSTPINYAHTHTLISSMGEKNPDRRMQTVAIFTGSLHVAEAARCTGVPPL